MIAKCFGAQFASARMRTVRLRGNGCALRDATVLLPRHRSATTQYRPRRLPRPDAMKVKVKGEVRNCSRNEQSSYGQYLRVRPTRNAFHAVFTVWYCNLLLRQWPTVLGNWYLRVTLFDHDFTIYLSTVNVKQKLLEGRLKSVGK